MKKTIAGIMMGLVLGASGATTNQYITSGVDTFATWASKINNNATNSLIEADGDARYAPITGSTNYATISAVAATNAVSLQRSTRLGSNGDLLYAHNGVDERIVFNDSAVGYREVTFVKRDDTFYAYFDYVETTNPSYPNSFGSVIYMATSSVQFIDWDQDSFSTPTELIPFGTSGEFDDGGSATPDAIDHNGTIYLFYSGRTDTNSSPRSLGYATSSNGMDFVKQGEIGNVSTWEDDPCVVYNPITDELNLFYTRVNDLHRRVYLKTSPAGSVSVNSWTDQGLVFDTGSNYICSDVVFDYSTRLYLMSDASGVAASSPDGLNWDLMTDEIQTPTESFKHMTFISDQAGRFLGLAFNDASSTNILTSPTPPTLDASSDFERVVVAGSYKGAELSIKNTADNTSFLWVENEDGDRIMSGGSDASGNGNLQIRNTDGTTTVNLDGSSGAITANGVITAGSVSSTSTDGGDGDFDSIDINNSGGPSQLNIKNNANNTSYITTYNATGGRIFTAGSDSSGNANFYIRNNLDSATIIFDGGTGRGTFALLNLSNLPTASTNLSSGDVWSDAGTLKVIP